MSSFMSVWISEKLCFFCTNNFYNLLCMMSCSTGDWGRTMITTRTTTIFLVFFLPRKATMEPNFLDSILLYITSLLNVNKVLRYVLKIIKNSWNYEWIKIEMLFHKIFWLHCVKMQKWSSTLVGRGATFPWHLNLHNYDIWSLFKCHRSAPKFITIESKSDVKTK